MLTKLTHTSIVVFTVITFVMAQGGGYALDFDGTSDYITINGSVLSYPWTAEVWYKRKASTNRQNFLWQSGGSNYWTLRFEQWSNTHKVGITKHAGSDKTWNHTTTIDNWEHLAFVASSSNTKTVELFVNGESQGFPGTFTSWPNLYWKYIGSGTSNTIDGEIDELRIWNDERTDDPKLILSTCNFVKIQISWCSQSIRVRTHERGRIVSD